LKSATETDNALTKKHADTDYSVISVLLCSFLFGGNYPHFGRITPRTLMLLICIISQHSDPCGVIFVLDVAALSLFAGVAAVFVAGEFRDTLLRRVGHMQLLRCDAAADTLEIDVGSHMLKLPVLRPAWESYGRRIAEIEKDHGYEEP